GSTARRTRANRSRCVAHPRPPRAARRGRRSTGCPRPSSFTCPQDDEHRPVPFRVTAGNAEHEPATLFQSHMGVDEALVSVEEPHPRHHHLPLHTLWNDLERATPGEGERLFAAPGARPALTFYDAESAVGGEALEMPAQENDHGVGAVEVAGTVRGGTHGRDL